MVVTARHYKVDALPKYVMRCGGGCVTACVMSFDNKDEAVWLANNDALNEIRSNKCASVEDSTILEQIFELEHNSKRDRCFKHMKSGSYDFKDLKVSDNLKSDMLPDAKLFTISFTCAPSQRGLGTEMKVYPVQLVFHVCDDEAALLLPAPFSYCHCPVGIGFCAHKGGFVLMLAAIRHFFKEHDFDALSLRLPPNIHSVASQLYLVRHIFPPEESLENTLDHMDTENDDKNDDAGYLSDNCGMQSQPSDNQQSDDIMLENIPGSTNGNDTSNMALNDMLAAVGTWCRDVEARLREYGVSHKVDTDMGKHESEKAAQIESDEHYLKRRNLRWQRLNRAVQDGKFPVCMLSFYCQDTAQNVDNDINNLSSYMEYNDNYDN